MVDQHSALRVKLSDIVEGMDFQSDERSSYLNLITGEVVSITDEELRAAENNAPLEDFPEWQHDQIRIAREMLETDHYLPLPDRFEVNEYRIMERFCHSILSAKYVRSHTGRLLCFNSGSRYVTACSRCSLMA